MLFFRSNGLSINSVIYPRTALRSPAPQSPQPRPRPSAAVNASASAGSAPSGPAAAAGHSADSQTDSTVSLASSDVTEFPAPSSNAAILASAQGQLGARMHVPIHRPGRCTGQCLRQERHGRASDAPARLDGHGKIPTGRWRTAGHEAGSALH